MTSARALVADDDPDILELVTLALERAGFTVESARDGAAALALAGERPPDVAVLDVAMPRLDGYAVTQALRSSPATAHAPVVLLTASVTGVDEELGLEAGADAFVKKPFGVRELVERVRALTAG